MNFDQFIKKTKDIRLSENEKATIKSSLLNFMSRNPLSDVSPRQVVRHDIWSRIFLTKLNFASAMAILLILSVLVTGGIAVGAEKALPGDILYPVKIGINEEVQGWLATSDQAKTDWEITKAERRLEEAEAMAEKGSLDEEASQKIEANFEANADRIRQRIDKFNSKEDFKAAASVSLNFENALKVHEKILTKLSEKKDVEARVRPIRVRVNAEVDKTDKSRQEINVKLKQKTSVDGEVKGDVDDNEDAHLNSSRDSVEDNTQFKVKLGL